jgi:hypothetical protein
MRKISELSEVRARIEPYRDEYGNIRMETVEFTARRRVRTTSPGLRFVHFFVDAMFFNLMLKIIEFLLSEININVNVLVSGFIGLLVFIPLAFGYSLLYTFFEYRFQKTPGKFITRSIVIDEYGNKPDL